MSSTPEKQSKILVIDDDPEQCALIAETLAAEGYDVRTASNAVDGLELFKADPPELVVVDFAMPIMNGIEFVKAMRAIETRRTLVLMVSGYAQSFLATLDSSSGVDSHLIKPILKHDLVMRVADMFAGRF
ncbi:MAG: response regulator [Anaerolineae bacterium]|nr:response regulator [Anaerolineae bacterium]MDW8298810.1 response regulator [Anaerolineae bacterium]